jgi:hypothetical protein
LKSSFPTCKTGALPLEPHLPPLLLWLFWRWVLIFAQAQPGPLSSYFTLSTVAGMPGACHYAQLFSLEMRSHKKKFFHPSCLGTLVLLISASQVARITDMSHQHSVFNFTLKKFFILIYLSEDLHV